MSQFLPELSHRSNTDKLLGFLHLSSRHTQTPHLNATKYPSVWFWRKGTSKSITSAVWNRQGSYIRSFVCLWRDSPQWARASSFTRFLAHTRCTTVSRTPLDEWSARHRDLYLTTHNTYNTQTPMPPVGFEPTISVGERPQTHALEHAATETGNLHSYVR